MKWVKGICSYCGSGVGGAAVDVHDVGEIEDYAQLEMCRICLSVGVSRYPHQNTDGRAITKMDLSRAVRVVISALEKPISRKPKKRVK